MKRHADLEGRAESAGPLFASIEHVYPREVAEMRRDLGMSRASSAAARKAPGWEDEAVAAVHEYARRHAHFLAEDVRREVGEPDGVDGRAWGVVLRRAQAEGFIATCGYAPANSSNRSPKVLWASKVFEGAQPA